MAALGGGALLEGFLPCRMGGANICFHLFGIKERMNCECGQRKPLYLLKQTKNKPPTENESVGVNATALASADQEGKKGPMAR